jgi:hypothetical protein
MDIPGKDGGMAHITSRTVLSSQSRFGEEMITGLDNDYQDWG